ncbi:MAG: hypothetical protein WB507_01605 [Solirubrobacterales bacterium]
MTASTTPPLSPEEVGRLLHQLKELTDDGRTVVVGGQAVYFWAYYFSQRDPDLLRGAPPTSGDLDLCGNRETVLRTAELLGGEARLPEIDHANPNAGIVRFRDSEGYNRILDIVTAPYGLAKRDLVDRAVRVRYQPPGTAAVHFWVMNPPHCMQSRVHNVIGRRQRSRLLHRHHRPKYQASIRAGADPIRYATMNTKSGRASISAIGSISYSATTPRITASKCPSFPLRGSGSAG